MRNRFAPLLTAPRRGRPVQRILPKLRIRQGICLAGIVFLACALANAEIRLPKIFGNNMVIQRGQPIHIWGNANPDAKVQVSFGSQTASTTADSDGAWQVTLEPVAVGGPYALTASSDGSATTLTNVLCGDVWLCSGQSNMQLPVKEVDPEEQKVALVDRPNLRLCSVAKTFSAKPSTNTDIQWRTCTPSSAKDFSAVACFFACELMKDPSLAHVPIGVVDSSFGGTTCEGWIPQPALAKFDPKDLHDSLFGIKPANLYNGMIAPLGRTALKGVLWYQGESNAAHPEMYPDLLATLVAEWRKQFDQPKLPFIIVQLPEYADLWEGYYWPWIREMQGRAASSIPNATLVVSLGTTDGFNLHPKEKLEIGRRAALAARRIAYGENVVASGPVFESAAIEGSSIRVKFDTDHDGLASTVSNGIAGFTLAGTNGQYYFAHARIDGDAVMVHSDEVPQPRTVRYAWAAMPQASLINRSGLPAGPFRTDTLPCSNVEIQKQRVTRRVATPAYDIVIDPNGMATSLIVDGAQFLSNEPGTAGGTSIPGFWGPRTLTDIREIGPRFLSCSDTEVTLRMTFQEKAMHWTIMNAGKDPINFQMALSPFVKAPDSIRDGKAVLSRGKATLTVDGFDTVTNTPTGTILISSIKGGTTKSIWLK